eukprot:c18987_g1_i3.p2 GENE.c18987_g1_i3~~c18987_g1_i3.p2  ORF type:complete len:151 (-),score=30.15 c18987_g1_i3:1022-1474(-)
MGDAVKCLTIFVVVFTHVPRRFHHKTSHGNLPHPFSDFGFHCTSNEIFHKKQHEQNVIDDKIQTNKGGKQNKMIPSRQKQIWRQHVSCLFRSVFKSDLSRTFPASFVNTARLSGPGFVLSTTTLLPSSSADTTAALHLASVLRFSRDTIV